MSLPVTAVCIIACCHGGPAGHLATFAKKLADEGYSVEVHALNGAAFQKFQAQDISKLEEFVLDQSDKSKNYQATATKIAKRCSEANASVVLTDVGHSFDIELQKALKVKVPAALSIAYYDNFEAIVYGGYSRVAAKVMPMADKILFANANLERAPLYYEEEGRLKEMELSQERVGLGYYPIDQAQKIVARREKEETAIRAQLFKENSLEDKGQEVLVYFGGNNDVYFKEAFPAFLEFLSEGIKETDLSNYVIVMQRHPSAKEEDSSLMEEWIEKEKNNPKAPKIIISNKASEDKQVLARKALYHQTSMGPLLALADISLVQVGRKTYEDSLVKTNLCRSVTKAEDLMQAITAKCVTSLSSSQRETILKSLDIKEEKECFKIFKQALVNKKNVIKPCQKNTIKPYLLAAGVIATVGCLAFCFFKAISKPTPTT